VSWNCSAAQCSSEDTGDIMIVVACRCRFRVGEG
jgi:hypothetical protein